MNCSCCGEERHRVAGLLCHQDIQVCSICVGWLRSQLGVVDSTPILPIVDMDASTEFYEAAGFDVERYEGGGYAFVAIDGESVLDLDASDVPFEPASNKAGCYLVVPDVDAWHSRLAALAAPVTPLEDQPWGMREFTLTDPSGNSLRFGRAAT